MGASQRQGQNNTTKIGKKIKNIRSGLNRIRIKFVFLKILINKKNSTTTGIKIPKTLTSVNNADIKEKKSELAIDGDCKNLIPANKLIMKNDIKTTSLLL